MKKTCKKIVVVCLLLMGILNNSFYTYASNHKGTTEPGNLYALSAVLMDGTSRKSVIWEKCRGARAMASTTKIMTCILILEQCDLEETAKTSAYAASMPKVHLGAMDKEKVLMKDLLYSQCWKISNDAAVVLAEHFRRKCFRFCSENE